MAVVEDDRWNFRTLLGQGVFKSVGDQFSSEKLVLPFLYTTLGGPVFFAGLLMPIVTVSTLGSQLFGAPAVKAALRSKWYLATAIGITASALALICLIAGDIPPVYLVVSFLSVAIVIGLAKGLVSLTFQDMLGRVLAESSRANLLFAIGAGGGLFAIVAGLVSYFSANPESPRDTQIGMMWAGIGMLVLAALVTVAVRETPREFPHPAEDGPPEANRKGYVTDLYGSVQVVSKLPWFRRFMIARLLFLSIELAMPFFAIHAARFHAATSISLSMFVVSASIGMVLGGIIWPRISKLSIRLVMAASALIAAVAGLIALASHLVGPLQVPVTHAFTFMLLAFAAQGIVNARTVYVVGAASDEQRPYCIAVSNVIAGLVGLVMALLVGSIAHAQGAIAGLMVMVVLNIVTALYVPRLTYVEHPGDHAVEPHVSHDDLALNAIINRAAARRPGADRLRRGRKTSSNPVPH
jgi:hypothetical protein